MREEWGINLHRFDPGHTFCVSVRRLGSGPALGMGEGLRLGLALGLGSGLGL